MQEFNHEQREQLEKDIEWLQSNEVNPREGELVLGRVLAPLLKIEGYSLEQARAAPDGGRDFIASRRVNTKHGESTETMAIELKLYRPGHRVGVPEVRALAGSSLTQNYDRVALVSNRGFTAGARSTAERDLPIRVELIDVDGLRDWVAERSRSKDVDIGLEVSLLMRDLSAELARMIAKSPDTLKYVEWRDVERIVAEVFHGLGFGVTLTDGSKDKGKDVILTCTVKGKQAEYYVEIKHWRSATRVGSSAIQKLLSVVVNEKKDGGLFLSTHGYTGNAFEQLTLLDKKTLGFGGQEKIVSICQTYVRAKLGLWSPPTDLSEVIFSDTEFDVDPSRAAPTY